MCYRADCWVGTNWHKPKPCKPCLKKFGTPDYYKSEI